MNIGKPEYMTAHRMVVVLKFNITAVVMINCNLISSFNQKEVPVLYLYQQPFTSNPSTPYVISKNLVRRNVRCQIANSNLPEQDTVPVVKNHASGSILCLWVTHEQPD